MIIVKYSKLQRINLHGGFDPEKLIHHCNSGISKRENMHYLKRMTRKKGEDAVSPVVGVMLMLVVTIIIAAVVSGFSGGLVGGQHKSPTISMDVKVVNSGSYIASGFFANVNSVSQPIATSQLKIVTTWTTTMKNDASYDLSPSQAAIANGTVFSGGNSSLPNAPNLGNFNPGMGTYPTQIAASVAPFGMGSFVSDITDPYEYNSSYFGQYTLQQGVTLFAVPFGAGGGETMAGSPGHASLTNGGYILPNDYVGGSSFMANGVDPAIAVLGGGWEQLAVGDIVHVKVIYTPTGTTIFSKDVPVTEA